MWFKVWRPSPNRSDTYSNLKGKRFYIVKCKICSNDIELFGDGYFKATKYELLNGTLPCGCATGAIKWNESQWEVRAKRQANLQNFKFNGWVEPFKGSRTKCRLICNDHACEWTSATVASLIAGLTNCPKDRYYNKLPYTGNFAGKSLANEDDVISRVVEKCEHLNIKFNGWVDEYKGTSTYCILECEEHGEWRTTNLTHLLSSKSKRCPSCSLRSISKAIKMDDQQHISDFLSTGVFAEGSKFKRISEIGEIAAWDVYCPVCNVTRTARQGNLKEGRRPCDCGRRQPDKCYIHSIVDNGVVVGVKFGITTNQDQRLRAQRSKTAFEIQVIGIWEMMDSKTARKCEARCLKSFECGIFSKQEIGDGFTETTWAHNLTEIISIYENYGGVRLE